VEYVRLGHSGLKISRVVVGCMGFGDPQAGTHAWAIGLDAARPLIRQALDAGITAFDTANSYSLGMSEEILGTVLAELGVREEVTIATKVFGRMAPGPNGGGLSRGAIQTQVEHSLRRLRTDHIDLYQIHRLDDDAPIEETMETLHDLVRAGKVRYIGASSMWTWQFVQAQHVAERRGWTRFVSMQDHYNLLMREEEREMHPYCLASGVGVLPWSPLARGRLTRPWDATTERGELDRLRDVLYRQTEDTDRQIVETVAAVAGECGVSPAQIALAWLLHKPAVTAPIVGVLQPSHIVDAVAAAELQLTGELIDRLEQHYVPHSPEGFS
jgi:aryl-alcohol dehydrogenase-like predicted oxidoreductase